LTLETQVDKDYIVNLHLSVTTETMGHN